MDIEKRMDNFEKKLTEIDKKLTEFISRIESDDKYKINQCEIYFTKLFVKHEQIPEIKKDIKQEIFNEIENKKIIEVDVMSKKTSIIKNIIDIFKNIFPWVILVIIYFSDKI